MLLYYDEALLALRNDYRSHFRSAAVAIHYDTLCTVGPLVERSSGSGNDREKRNVT